MGYTRGDCEVLVCSKESPNNDGLSLFSGTRDKLKETSSFTGSESETIVRVSILVSGKIVQTKRDSSTDL